MIVFVLQFEDVGSHGTKVLIYNLWMNDDGLLELDFDDDEEVHIIPILFYFNICQDRRTKELLLYLFFLARPMRMQNIHHKKY